MLFTVLIILNCFLRREMKMANCPNCNIDLDQDFLDSGMDALLKNISLNIFTAQKQCLNCENEIQFHNNGGRYYVVSEGQRLEPIGAR